MALPLLPNVDEWELRGGGEDSFGALEGISLDDGFLVDMLDDTGTSFGADMPPTSGGDGGFGPGGGGASVASYALRCIDESHPLDCARCTPAPEDPDQVELLGDRGRKNGEKRLRALMTRIPEWNLATERAKLIPVAHAAGMPALASALQTKKTSALRKAHLLLMARHWHYRSDIWSVRHDRAAKKAMEDLKRRAVQQQPVRLCRFGEAAAAAAAGQWDESILAPEAVWLFTRKELRPLSMRVAAAFAGDEARIAALEHGDAHITPSACLEVRKVADMAAPMLSQLGFVHTALLSAQRALPAHMASMPAWQTLSVAPFSAAEALLKGVLQSGLSHMSVVRRSSARRLRKGGLSAGEAAWLAEMERSHATSLILLNKVARVLNAFRAAALEDFLEVAGHMLELLIVLVNSLGSAATSRERWMRDLMEARSSREADPERSAVLVCWPPKPEELMEGDIDGETDTTM